MREWIADVASEECENAGRLWSEVLTAIYPIIQPDKLKVSAEERQRLFAVLVGGLWLSYDIQKPFIPQLEENFKQIMAILEEIK